MPDCCHNQQSFQAECCQRLIAANLRSIGGLNPSRKVFFPRDSRDSAVNLWSHYRRPSLFYFLSDGRRRKMEGVALGLRLEQFKGILTNSFFFSRFLFFFIIIIIFFFFFFFKIIFIFSLALYQPSQATWTGFRAKMSIRIYFRINFVCSICIMFLIVLQSLNKIIIIIIIIINSVEVLRWFCALIVIPNIKITLL